MQIDKLIKNGRYQYVGFLVAENRSIVNKIKGKMYFLFKSENGEIKRVENNHIQGSTEDNPNGMFALFINDINNYVNVEVLSFDEVTITVVTQ